MEIAQEHVWNIALDDGMCSASADERLIENLCKSLINKLYERFDTLFSDIDDIPVNASVYKAYYANACRLIAQGKKAKTKSRDKTVIAAYKAAIEDVLLSYRLAVCDVDTSLMPAQLKKIEDELLRSTLSKVKRAA